MVFLPMGEKTEEIISATFFHLSHKMVEATLTHFSIFLLNLLLLVYEFYIYIYIFSVFFMSRKALDTWGS